jgi:hypothetical protein
MPLASVPFEKILLNSKPKNFLKREQGGHPS